MRAALGVGGEMLVAAVPAALGVAVVPLAVVVRVASGVAVEMLAAVVPTVLVSPWWRLMASVW